jgi:hypothetical protein
MGKAISKKVIVLTGLRDMSDNGKDIGSEMRIMPVSNT